MNLSDPTLQPATRLLQPIIAKLYADSEEASSVLLVTHQRQDNPSDIKKDLSDVLPANVTWQHVDSQMFNTQKFAKQYELALIIASLNGDNDEATRKSIQLCRDLYGRHTLVIKPIASQLNLTAFGFSRLTTESLSLADEDVELWQFNLFDYKQLPDWLNSKFWANPENWGKFRW